MALEWVFPILSAVAGAPLGQLSSVPFAADSDDVSFWRMVRRITVNGQAVVAADTTAIRGTLFVFGQKQ